MILKCTEIQTIHFLFKLKLLHSTKATISSTYVCTQHVQSLVIILKKLFQKSVLLRSEISQLLLERQFTPQKDSKIISTCSLDFFHKTARKCYLPQLQKQVKRTNPGRSTEHTYSMDCEFSVFLQPYAFTLHLLVSSRNFLKKLNNIIFIKCQKIGEMMQRVHHSVAIQIVQMLQQNLPWDSNTARENKEVTQI